jgi:hypothetical protein
MGREVSLTEEIEVNGIATGLETVVRAVERINPSTWPETEYERADAILTNAIERLVKARAWIIRGYPPGMTPTLEDREKLKDEIEAKLLEVLSKKVFHD